MARKGFGPNIMKWTMGCVSSSHFFVIIKGTPKGLFRATRVPGEGDPLSPFLFTLVVGSFIHSPKGKERKVIFKIGSEEIKLSHL